MGLLPFLRVQSVASNRVSSKAHTAARFVLSTCCPGTILRSVSKEKTRRSSGLPRSRWDMEILEKDGAKGLSVDETV